MMEEIWKDVPGFEGLYQASTLGRIKSLSRHGLSYESVLTPLKSNLGYLFIRLFHGKETIKIYIHRLIMETFIGPSELPVDHLNGVKTDNSVSNLEYVTPQENSRRYFQRVSKTGLPVGVFKCKSKKNPYMAKIIINKKQVYLGNFKTIEDAINARNIAHNNHYSINNGSHGLD